MSIGLGACSASSSYMGISLTPGAATNDVQTLARRAEGGDKQAQLKLGEAFESGIGVPVNLKTALALYRQAASDTGGSIWIYIPSTSSSQNGRSIQVEQGQKFPGLGEAKQKLARLQKQIADVRVNSRWNANDAKKKSQKNDKYENVDLELRRNYVYFLGILR